MRKIIIFFGVMIFVIIFIPAIIVCSFAANEKSPPPTSPSHEKTQNATGSPSPTGTNIFPGKTSSPIIEQSQTKITVYNKAKDEVVDMDLEDYVKGVVLGEMPLSFELEALKAQALVARTYAYRRIFQNSKNNDHPDALICTDSEHCQSWSDPDNLLERLGGQNNKDAVEKANKLNEAISATKGLIITYENKPIDALYHSNSGGMTEDASQVWTGTGVPYLLSVKSDGETNSDVFKTTYEISCNDFVNKLKSEYNDIKLNEKNIFDDIKDIQRSASDRILKVRIGNKEMTGRDLRRIFDLRSTNIWFSNKPKDKITIITYGNGHGVGLSQYGANARAQEKMNFDEIIKFYYKNVDIKSIEAINR